MNDTEQLALIYEASILVENAEARIAFLWNRYGAKLTQLIIESDFYFLGDDNVNDNETHEAQGAIDVIVNHIDPTHGKYSEWILKRVIAMFPMSGSTWENLFECDQDLIRHPGEDAYKIIDALTLFDKHKIKLPPDQRDINKYDLDSLDIVTAQWENADPTTNELVAKIKQQQTLKLVDNLDGWTVVIPLTMASARIYGAGTKWCTAARSDDHNAFDEYNDSGPLVIFINNQTKYQFWADITKVRSNLPVDPVRAMELAQTGQIEVRHNTYHFMDAKDHPCALTNVPDNVWRASGNALADNKHNTNYVYAGYVMLKLFGAV